MCFGVWKKKFQALENIGVISGHDMTAEAALTKLCYVLGIPGLSYKERAMVKIIRRKRFSIFFLNFSLWKKIFEENWLIIIITTETCRNLR